MKAMFFNTRVVSIISLLILLLPFLKLTESETTADFMDGNFANAVKYKTFSGFGIAIYSAQNISKGIPALFLLFLAIFTVAIFQAVLMIFKRNKLVPFLSFSLSSNLLALTNCRLAFRNLIWILCVWPISVTDLLSSIIKLSNALFLAD